MAFNQFTLDGMNGSGMNTEAATGTFVSVGNNSYQLNTLPWGYPPDGIKFSPGRLSGPKSPTQAAITRIIQVPIVDPTTSAINGYAKHSITVMFTIPGTGGSLTALREGLSQICQVLGYQALTTDATPSISDALQRLLRGES